MALVMVSGCGGPRAGGEGKLNICVSSTDVAAIVRAVGGDAVQVTGLVKGEDDPHIVAPTRRMVESLARADLLVVAGLGLEDTWLPAMLTQAGNADVRPGSDGHLDLSHNVRSIAMPQSQGAYGSFHPEANPHYLLDPIEGIKAAKAVADRLAVLRPEQADVFTQNYDAFAREIMVAMIGEELAGKIAPADIEAIAIAIENGELSEYLEAHGGGSAALDGWLAAFGPLRGSSVVGDHDLWPYLSRRYGLEILGHLEPEPGMPPTAPHLMGLVKQMQDDGCRVILSVQHFDPRHAIFVADLTGARIVPMISQPGGRTDTETYLDFVNYNARQLLAALQSVETEANSNDNN